MSKRDQPSPLPPPDDRPAHRPTRRYRICGAGLAGVADVAEERDVNLVCFVGGTLCAPHEFDSQRNVAYDLASPERLDGLLAMSGRSPVCWTGATQRILCALSALPMVSIAMAVDGIPNV